MAGVTLPDRAKIDARFLLARWPAAPPTSVRLSPKEPAMKSLLIAAPRWLRLGLVAGSYLPGPRGTARHPRWDRRRVARAARLSARQGQETVTAMVTQFRPTGQNFVAWAAAPAFPSSQSGTAHPATLRIGR